MFINNPAPAPIAAITAAPIPTSPVLIPFCISSASSSSASSESAASSSSTKSCSAFVPSSISSSGNLSSSSITIFSFSFKIVPKSTLFTSSVTSNFSLYSGVKYPLGALVSSSIYVPASLNFEDTTPFLSLVIVSINLAFPSVTLYSLNSAPARTVFLSIESTFVAVKLYSIFSSSFSLFSILPKLTTFLLSVTSNVFLKFGSS